MDLLGCKQDEIILASAKTGEGINEILKAIVERIPAPKNKLNDELKALIFDSVYNPFRGIEIYFRVFSGKITKGQEIKFFATNKSYYADGIFGQFIWVDPDSKTVIAMHSARDVAALDRYSGGHRLNFLISLIEEINK